MEAVLTLDSFNEDDGKIVLNISEDYMEARGDFYPSRFDGRPINQNYVRKLLDEYKIIYGIKKDEISRAYKKCVSENVSVLNVLIAHGTPPEKEVPEYLQLNPYLGRQKKSEMKNGRLDHKARTPFTIVKKDQALAVIKPRKTGKNGVNILGEAVRFELIRPESVTAGENTRMEGKYLLAGIDGQLIHTKGELSIRDSLVIKGPIGYKTGNIDFPGDVMIEGPVSDGFIIHSGGSISIKQTFDVTDASCKNDLLVAGGIIGRGKAVIKVGGKLRTKFIENCSVACRDKIMVDTEILNSKIYTMETLEMGDKGNIIGGEIYAIKGISVGGLGRKTGRAARVHCGVDFTMEQEREKNNGILKMLSIKIMRIKDLLGEMDGNSKNGKKEKLEEALLKLEDEQNKIQEKINEILGSLSNFEDAVVEVRGEIVPGTLIEICNTALFVTESLKKVRIKLDKTNNKLVSESI